MKKLLKETFLSLANEKFGGAYQYIVDDFNGADSMVGVVCQTHGRVDQIARLHLKSKGCRECSFHKPTSKFTHQDFLKKCFEVYGGRYEYPEEYTGMHTSIRIVCKKHGEFKQKPMVHLSNRTKTNIGCPGCVKDFLATSQRKGTDWFITKAKEVHGGKYDYDLVSYTNSKGQVDIVCGEHGIFTQIAHNHLQGSQCPKCAISDVLMRSLPSRQENFLAKLAEVHGDFYQIISEDYIANNKKIRVLCPIHGEFKQIPSDLVGGHGCRKCAITKSNQEEVLYEFLKTLNTPILRRDRSGIAGVYSNGKLELDFVLPEFRLAIEVNGNYWHSTAARDGDVKWAKNHMNNKRLTTNSNGYRLLHFFGDEIQYMPEIVFGTIKSILGLAKDKVFARKTIARNISWAEAKEFIKRNHLQQTAKISPAKGLFFNNELVAVMLFDRLTSHRGNTNTNNFEIIRYCSTIRVVGGCSKLLMAFLAETPECQIVVSYSDNRYSNGDMYKAMNFEYKWDSPPDYCYIKAPYTLRYHKSSFRRARLAKILPNFDPALTERENCHNHKIYQLFDCGKKRWELKVNS